MRQMLNACNFMRRMYDINDYTNGLAELSATVRKRVEDFTMILQHMSDACGTVPCSRPFPPNKRRRRQPSAMCRHFILDLGAVGGEFAMAKLIAIDHVTLDGVMQGPGAPDEDTRHGFEYGGWASPQYDPELSRHSLRVWAPRGRCLQAEGLASISPTCGPVCRDPIRLPTF